jgi:hypothetical protein
MSGAAHPRLAWARWLLDGSKSKEYTIYIVALTLFTLFANDFRLAFLPKGADGTITGLIFTCFLLFVLEMLVLSWVQPKYLNSVFFWLDFIALLSLIPDIPFMAEALFGSQHDIQQFSVTRASRTARIGSRAGRFARLVKVARLLRLLRMLRLLKTSRWTENITKKLNRRDTRRVQSDMSRTVVESVSKRVVCIVLVVVIICFLCQPAWADNSRSNILYRLNQFDAAKVAPGASGDQARGVIGIFNVTWHQFLEQQPECISLKVHGTLYSLYTILTLYTVHYIP